MGTYADASIETFVGDFYPADGAGPLNAVAITGAGVLLVALRALGRRFGIETALGD
jgi:hypothetical protein